MLVVLRRTFDTGPHRRLPTVGHQQSVPLVPTDLAALTVRLPPVTRDTR
jgi:hypothetical protein